LSAGAAIAPIMRMRKTITISRGHKGPEERARLGVCISYPNDYDLRHGSTAPSVTVTSSCPSATAFPPIEAVNTAAIRPMSTARQGIAGPPDGPRCLPVRNGAATGRPTAL
jgi:hypothetical protein